MWCIGVQVEECNGDVTTHKSRIQSGTRNPGFHLMTFSSLSKAAWHIVRLKTLSCLVTHTHTHTISQRQISLQRLDELLVAESLFSLT